MREPKLKDSYRLHKNEHHPIGKLNEDIVRKIGEQIIYMIYIGRKDLCGDDWGDIYANAIGANIWESRTLETFFQDMEVCSTALIALSWLSLRPAFTFILFPFSNRK